jgi:hypothetical protein
MVNTVLSGGAAELTSSADARLFGAGTVMACPNAEITRDVPVDATPVNVILFFLS